MASGGAPDWDLMQQAGFRMSKDAEAAQASGHKFGPMEGRAAQQILAGSGRVRGNRTRQELMRRTRAIR